MAEAERQAVTPSARVPQQRRSRETQERILAAALALFAEQGFEGASTHEIARRAGVNQPLVLYHFGSKQQLWLAAAERIFDELLDRFGPRIEWLAGLDTATRLKLILADFVIFSAEHPELHQFMIEANKHGDSQLDRLVESRLRPMFQLVCREIEEAQALGAMLPGDPAILYYAMIGAAASLFALSAEFKLVTGRDATDPETVEAQAAAIVQLFFPARGVGILGADSLP